MCGIAVIINRENVPVRRELLAGFTRLVRHRGPDDEGFFLHSRVGLGHSRLAVFDTSGAGQQPMLLSRYAIVFNGAIYNYLELKTELERSGYHFSSHTDTEVILAAFDHWGEACTDRFNGMWAFVIYDRLEERLFASRDRFGIKPLYYARIGDLFCLASEIKQFTALPGWRCRMNRLRCYEYLAYGYRDHTAETLFSGVLQILPGHNLIYDLRRNQFVLKQFYNPADRIREWTSDQVGATHQLRSLLEDAVRLRMRADVQIGSALSGGLDSSSIVALMHSLLDVRAPEVKTVSVCFKPRHINEEIYVDALARVIPIRSHKVRPGSKEVLDAIEKVVWHQDGPIASAGVVVQHLLFRRAADEGIKVMLDGQGADEILGGYEKFYLPYFRALWAESPFTGLGAAWNVATSHTWSARGLQRQIAFVLAKQRQKKFSWFNPDFIPPPDQLYERAPATTFTEVSLGLLRDVGLRILLHYEDRNSAAFGIESRVPFLDHRLVEFCLGLPARFKIRNGIRKHLLRIAMEDLLPQEITGRYDKLGFATPENSWFGTEVGKAITEVKQRFPGIFNIDRQQPHTDPEWWRIVTFGEWLKLFNVE